MSNSRLLKADIFVSYVEENSDVVKQLAEGLEKAGYTTWYYERDALPGVTYLTQVREAIDQARVVVVVISQDFLRARASHTMTEVVRAYEQGKPLIPVLLDTTHAELQERKPDLAQCLGAAVSIRIPSEGVPAVLPRIVGGLIALGLQPTAAGKAPIPEAAERTVESPVCPKEPQSVGQKAPSTQQQQEKSLGRWKLSWPKRPRRRVIVSTAQFIGILAIAVVLVLIAGKAWRSIHGMDSAGPGKSGQAPAKTTATGESSAHQTLRAYKVDIYFDKDSSYDREIASRIGAILAESTIVKQVVLVPRSIDFLSAVGRHLSYEVRYFSQEEYGVASVLATILNRVDQNKPEPWLGFEPRRVGTPTPGTLSIFIFSRVRIHTKELP